MKIDGKLYKRDTGNMYDGTIEIDELGHFGDMGMVQEMVTCHVCSVHCGNVHHIGCSRERCPICHDQFISCGHNLEVRYYKGLEDNRGRFKRGMMHPLMKAKMEARFDQ